MGQAGAKGNMGETGSAMFARSFANIYPFDSCSKASFSVAKPRGATVGQLMRVRGGAGTTVGQLMRVRGATTLFI